ncbi:MAG: hypothetical protein PHR35_15350, partial [Kiritimatiellae bacterium]|nr:hypothetical protein [Kiritimatiellia bacterium]
LATGIDPWQQFVLALFPQRLLVAEDDLSGCVHRVASPCKRVKRNPLYRAGRRQKGGSRQNDTRIVVRVLVIYLRQKKLIYQGIWQ